MILGNVCTRTCSFCDVKSGHPLVVNENEPMEVCASAKILGLKYVVVTSVTRDDLADGGAHQFVKVAEMLRREIEGVGIEFLIPDFKGDSDLLNIILQCKPTVLNHNLETVKRLTPIVRSKAIYHRSLELLSRAKNRGAEKVKTGIMVGLGETREELLEFFDDAAATGCDILTIGQYLRPSRDKLEVKRYLPPEEFEELRRSAMARGLKTVYSGPFVRSSFNAGEIAKQSFDLVSHKN